ncbi:MAG: hypothetical protein H7Y42_12060 [Chitinophagaceae bacterium]|nr:hypothetical protein [Chitinophagaceae bacterium]
MVRTALTLFLLATTCSAFSQSAIAEAKPDSVRIRSEVKALENIRKQMTDKVRKLAIACREDSIGILNLKNNREDVSLQCAKLKTGIVELEKNKNKTKEQKKLLKDLKQGHIDIQTRIKGMEKELGDIEINYKASTSLLTNAQKMLKDLTHELQELRRLLSPK